MSSNSETLNFVVNSTNQTQLTHPGDSAITSQTSDKIKGAIFSIIESQKYSPSLQNRSFLDICSGG